MSTETMPLYVRPAEASRLIGVGKTKLYEMIAAGDLRPVKLGRATLIEVAEVRALMERLRSAAA